MRAENLFANAHDSIRHALDHFFEPAVGKERVEHHKKWAILSVHHAAECYCKAVLFENDPQNPAFFRGGKKWSPSLHKALQTLKSTKLARPLTPAELRLLDLVENMNEVRNQLMHRDLIQDLDVSTAAMCFIGLARMLSVRQNTTVKWIIGEHSEIQSIIVDAIRCHTLIQYYQFAEAFVIERNHGQSIETCPVCGYEGVVKTSCEVCFAGLTRSECAQCGEELVLPADEWLRDEYGDKCPYCPVDAGRSRKIP